MCTVSVVIFFWIMSVPIDDCLLCAKHLTKRRPIHSPSNVHVLPALQEIAIELFGSESILSSQVVCTSCLRNVEKLMDMRVSLKQKEKAITEQMERAGKRYGIARRAPSSPLTTPIRAVQPHMSSTPLRQHPRSRGKIASPFATATPIRQILVPSGSSPAVAVRK